MTAKSKQMCGGFRDDYYNHQSEKGCWSFQSATVVERIRVGIWEPPPYSPDRKTQCLSCYSPEGSSMIKLDDCRVGRRVPDSESGVQSGESSE